MNELQISGDGHDYATKICSSRIGKQSSKYKDINACQRQTRKQDRTGGKVSSASSQDFGLFTTSGIKQRGQLQLQEEKALCDETCCQEFSNGLDNVHW